MAVINGGLVLGLSVAEEVELVSRKNRHLLLQHRAKHFYYLFDRLVMSCSDIQMLTEYVKDKVSDHWYRNIRGRVVGMVLIRYMNYLLNPQWYAYRGDLIFYANWVIIQQYLQRVTKVLILDYGFENKHYAFKIKKDRLFRLSGMFYDDMHDTAKKMVEHYRKLERKRGH